MCIRLGNRMIEIHDKYLTPVDKLPTDDPNKIVYLISSNYSAEDNLSMYFESKLYKATIKDISNTYSKDIYIHILINKQTKENTGMHIYLVEDKI